MKNLIIKSCKGMTALILAALVVSTISFVIQSCSLNIEPRDTQKELARSHFENLAKATAPQLQEIARERTKMVSMAGKGDKREEELNKRARKKLAPLLKAGRELLEAYEFSDEVFKGTGMSKNDPQAIYLAFAIIKSENLQKSESSFGSILLNSCVEPAYASKFWNCAKVAAGIEFGLELLRQREMMTISGKKMLIKMFTKIGAKYLGYVGIAIATYDFIDCMWLSE